MKQTAIGLTLNQERDLRNDFSSFRMFRSGVILRRVGLKPAVNGGMIIPVSELLDPSVFIFEPEPLPDTTKISVEKEGMTIKISRQAYFFGTFSTSL